MARQRRRVERSTNGSITSTNRSTGLRSSTVPTMDVARKYGPNGTHVARQFTVRNRSVSRISGS